MDRYTEVDEFKAIGIIDTGTSMIAIPKTDFDIISTKWKRAISDFEHFNCTEDGLCYGDQTCDKFEEKVHNISFTFDN